MLNMIGFLPPFDAPGPSSLTNPSFISSSTRKETVDLFKPVICAISALEIFPFFLWY